MTLGMLVGWSGLGVAVGLGTVFVEESLEIFQAINSDRCSISHSPTGWKVANSPSPKMHESEQTERLGFKTGLISTNCEWESMDPFPGSR